MTTNQYDLAIVGSGGAAIAAAVAASRQQARIVMVERGVIGGTCVNIGCVPSKTLLRGTEIYHQAGQHPFAGLETSAGRVTLPETIRQKDTLVEQLREQKYTALIADYGWELVRGEASFLDSETLQVAGRKIRANAFIIATGAAPRVPPITGLEQGGYLTSTTALALTEVPNSLFVIGAGYIALELGQIFSRLGTEVTPVQRGTHFLNGYEPETDELMRAVLAEQGIDVITEAQIEQVEGGERGRRVHLTVRGKPQIREASHVLVAAGRTPNTAALNLHAAGVRTDGRRAVIVDGHLSTSNPKVWAVGDVTLSPQFVYVAAYEGRLAAENALLGSGRTVDFTALPAVIFTDPQIAVVGLTEAEAVEQGLAVKSTVLPLEAVPRAQVNHDTAGLIKLVIEAGSERLLGVHVVSENAGR